MSDQRRPIDENPKPWRCCGHQIGGSHRRCPSCGGRRIRVDDLDQAQSVHVHDAHADSLYGGR